MLQLQRTTSANNGFIQLVSWLEEELRIRYGAVQELYEQLNKVSDLDTVVVAYLQGKAIGCGCFKKYTNELVEIKRMYVAVEGRRKGTGKAILNELEDWAIEEGYIGAVLETGEKQPESIKLYTSCGYQQIANYEPYMDMVESLCFGKKFI